MCQAIQAPLKPHETNTFRCEVSSLKRKMPWAKDSTSTNLSSSTSMIGVPRPLVPIQSDHG